MANPPKCATLSAPIRNPRTKIDTTHEIKRDLIACIEAPPRFVVTAIIAPSNPISAPLAPAAGWKKTLMAKPAMPVNM